MFNKSQISNDYRYQMYDYVIKLEDYSTFYFFRASSHRNASFKNATRLISDQQIRLNTFDEWIDLNEKHGNILFKYLQ